MYSLKNRLLICVIASFLSTFTYAQPNKTLETSATFLLTHQQTLQSQSIEESQFSVDVEFDYNDNQKGWFTWFEYSSTPDTDGVATVFDGSNSDVGTTTDENGSGRVQLSSLYYYDETPNAPIHWLVGITQVTALIDTTDVANDEIEQFLSGTLLNNPTIAFPDYTLSAQITLRDAIQNGELVFLVANSNGLADEDGNYADAWQPFGSNQGMFAAIEWIHQRNNATISNGLWVNTKAQSRGWYISSDLNVKRATFNLRLGIADTNRSNQLITNPAEDEANDKTFIGLAVKYPFSNGLLAAGWTHTKTDIAALPGKQIAELYYRLAYSESIHITPSLQWRKRHNFNPQPQQDTWIAGIRYQQDL